MKLGGADRRASAASEGGLLPLEAADEILELDEYELLADGRQGGEQVVADVFVVLQADR